MQPQAFATNGSWNTIIKGMFKNTKSTIFSNGAIIAGMAPSLVIVCGLQCKGVRDFFVNLLWFIKSPFNVIVTRCPARIVCAPIV